MCYVADEPCFTNGLSIKAYDHTIADDEVWILPHLTIDCHGVISKWSFFATGNGAVVFTVWEQLSLRSFRLIGKNRVNITTADQGRYVGEHK